MSSNPAPFTIKTTLVKMAMGSHITKSTCQAKTQSPYSGFCYARNAYVMRCRPCTGGRFYDTGKLLRLSTSVQALPLDVITPDSYAWSYRELAALLTQKESLAEGGFEPLAIGSMRKNLLTERCGVSYFITSSSQSSYDSRRLHRYISKEEHEIPNLDNFTGTALRRSGISFLSL